MKKIALLLIFALIFALSVCMTSADTDDTDVSVLDPSDTRENEAPTDTREHSDAVKAANEALFELFPELKKIGTAAFEIEERPNANDHTRLRVSYDFTLCGMNTYESYSISLIRNGDGYKVEKDNCFGSNEGVYSKFYFDCTEKKIAAAKAELDSMLDPEADSSGYYLSTNDDGALVMQVEEIVDLTPPPGETDGGCGIDHEHVFHTVVICE